MSEQNLRCETLTSFSDVQKIAPEWNALHEHIGKPLFRDFDAFDNWWRTLGQEEPVQPHVIVAWSPEGDLKAVWPLVQHRHGILDVVQQAGTKVFDNGDILAETREDAEALGHYLRSEDPHDIAIIKDIRETDLSFSQLSASMQRQKQHKNFFLTLTFPSGDEWFAAQSRKLRSDVHRKSKKMEGLGGLSFSTWREGDPAPDLIVDALYEQKKEWAQARGLTESCFLRPRMRDFLHGLVWDAARKGILYLSWICSGNSIAACHLGFIRNNVLSLYITTYSEDFAAFSPGNLLMVGTIRNAIDAGLHELDFMRGDEDYKQRFSGNARLFSNFVGGRSLLGKSVVQLRRIFNGTR